MRIVIDLQGAQASNRNRGIGRYSLSFAEAIVRNRGEHDVFIALNGLFGESIDGIRSLFQDLLPAENIRIWHATPPLSHAEECNQNWRKVAEYTREAFLGSLHPDVVIVSSLFEGLGDDAATSIRLLPSYWLTAVILYDLIPHIYPIQYLANPKVAKWYEEKLSFLKSADLWLAISESSRQEGIKHLGLATECSFNVGADADSCFRRAEIDSEKEQALRHRYRISRPFVMYTGGIDHRKNISGLIRSFAKLPLDVRNRYQLAIICSVQPHEQAAHQEIVLQCGLNSDDVIFTGFVSEEDLIALYSLCNLFIFPSLHEGFGLPALEAMRCGAPTIGSKVSSLPEVIGWSEALFDPHSEASMVDLMARALTDEAYYEELRKNAARQSKCFSWDQTALKALDALASAHEAQTKEDFDQGATPRLKLAYVSPLPPERSGISDYSAELIPALSVHYDIDVIVDQGEITDPWIKEHCNIRTLDWFIDNNCLYDRIVYHFGNSAFHGHMFALLEAIPGVIVLHDFYLSGILAYLDLNGSAPGLWDRGLYHSHGYPALADRYRNEDKTQTIWKYPCNLVSIDRSLGVIVHSKHSVELSEEWYGCTPTRWRIIPLLRKTPKTLSPQEAKVLLGFKPEDFLVCSFGMLGPTKLNDRLIQAWVESKLSRTRHCHLVFVGANNLDSYGVSIAQLAQESECSERIQITGWTDADKFRLFLTAADIGVQLRTLSRGETSAAILDCMNHGLASIVNANGSMAHLDPEAVYLLPDNFSVEDLKQALEILEVDDALRTKIGDYARNLIHEKHNPKGCASMYQTAIEKFYRVSRASHYTLPKSVARLKAKFNSNDLKHISNCLARSFQPEVRQRQLLVDVSELVQRDVGTGIQRVVKSILANWLKATSADYRVEPVFVHPTSGTYYYARKFTLNFLGMPDKLLDDEPIDFYPGDIFFVLDLQPQSQISCQNFYKLLRRQGVKLKFMVYDLLCVQLPQFFPPGAYSTYKKWLKVVSESDGAICISKTVADEFDDWRRSNTDSTNRPFETTWFHLGSDVENSKPTSGIPLGAESMFRKLSNGVSFLMVGTLEPRKGHEQVIAAFERIWETDDNINLVIVGKPGWLINDLLEQLAAHPELGQRLFWLDSVSDEYLDRIYEHADCIIGASYGEGFGLPLIEAARYSKPLFVRDIPVFREVAGENATYFDASSSAELAKQLMVFVSDLNTGRAIPSSGISQVSWSMAAKNLYSQLTK